MAGIPRSRKMISASTSSATERVLENGALKTGMPRIMAASRSIWLVPMQKAPMAISCGAAAMASAVRRVRERMPTKWTSAMAALQVVAGQRLLVALDLRVAVAGEVLDRAVVHALQQEDLHARLLDGRGQGILRLPENRVSL